MKPETRPNPKLTPIHKDPTFYVLLAISLPGILAAYLAAWHGLATGEFNGEQFLNAAFAVPIVAYLGVFRQFPRAKSVEQIGQIEQARIQNEVMDGGPLAMSPIFNDEPMDTEELRVHLKSVLGSMEDDTAAGDIGTVNMGHHFPSGDDVGVSVTLPDGEVAHGVTQDFADKIVAAQEKAGPVAETGSLPLSNAPVDDPSTPPIPHDALVNGEDIIGDDDAPLTESEEQDCPPFKYHDREPTTGECRFCGKVVPAIGDTNA